MDPTRRARERLASLEADGLLRRAPAISERNGVRYHLDGRPVVGLCSNDYLGLADDPRLRQPLTVPSGAGASRLISGDLPCHRELEARLASLVEADDAVLFPSGFQLNVGVLPTLLEPADQVDSDALNHASLIDGMRLARARPTILAHAEPPLPRPLRTDGVHWWITESIFSMDGDRLDPSAARTHLERGAAMLVDEAHALGLFRRGRGWLGHHDLHPTVVVGTLSKAFGCAGAFVAASRPLCDLIRNRARSFVFSTGTSPVLVARILRSIELVTGSEGDELRERLWANVRHLAALLDPSDRDPPSPIFPIVIGDNALAVSLANRLLEHGWHVQAIRPPTVPVGTARLRLTVSAAHHPAQLDAFAHDLRRLLEDEGLPLRIERGLAPAAPTPTTDARRHA
ncbi:MAG: aminotransferase class I/II-fold pyridoxal phosphate-dependent enzyme [Myxococcales bacterium]|nr:aminotransferase class I/II-fold pyridoxal phosphate-dependent enzyme [Myxococcales bacterium]MCB9718070.1 aminotransferase class I/II-fold pyridoxal phosphate-dependent enzyme [Myxococcales bacterium]